VLAAAVVALVALYATKTGSDDSGSTGGSGNSLGSGQTTTTMSPICAACNTTGGACIANVCVCNAGYYGANCEHACTNLCGGGTRGECGSNGRCLCHTGFTGDACENTKSSAMVNVRGEPYTFSIGSFASLVSSLLGVPVANVKVTGFQVAEVGLLVPIEFVGTADSPTAQNMTETLTDMAETKDPAIVNLGIISVATEESPTVVVVQAPCPNDCSGHGECQRDGACLCEKGYKNNDCGQAPILVRCLDDCSNSGQCVSGKCICDDGWIGENCGAYKKSCPENCNGNGVCNEFLGTCTCSAGYDGAGCEYKLCPNDCSTQGQCLQPSGVCKCNKGFTGLDCSIKECLMGCGIGGNCIDGVCVCHIGWNKEDCSVLGCPDNCAGIGECKRDTTSDLYRCFCPPNRRGAACQSEVEILCADGRDNDGDNLFDCDDPECCEQSVCKDQDVCAVAPNPADGVVVEDPSSEEFVPFFETVRFMVEGDMAIQFNATLDSWDTTLASVVNGRVLTGDGEPLAGATIRYADHPEFGFTRTREDGRYDFVLYGGGWLSVSFERRSFIVVQRRYNVPVNAHFNVEDVMLMPVSKVSTTIYLNNNNTYQVATSEKIVDASGQRQALVMFPPNTQAMVVEADGTERVLAQPQVRITEFTVGANGASNMPGQLPTQTAITMAFEASVDQVPVSAGEDGTLGGNVVYNKPLLYYVENFLQFPVGSAVPMASYDRATGAWVPSQDGVVMRITSIVNGVAQLELRPKAEELVSAIEDSASTFDGGADEAANVDPVAEPGTSAPDSSAGPISLCGDPEPEVDANGIETASTIADLEKKFNITLEEKKRLATLYKAGAELWRVPITQ
jgi:hypothetical protein